MSTFTNWNGPGGCSPDDLPVFKKLKELYELIESVKITAEAAATHTYVDGKADAARDAAITEAQVRISAAVTALNSLISALTSRVTTTENDISSLKSIIGTLTNIKQYVDTAIATLNASITAEIGVINGKIGTVPVGKNVIGLITEISTALTQLNSTLFTTDGLIKIGIFTEADIQVGKIKANQLLDFDVWQLGNAPHPAVTNKPYQVAILGVLSQDWRDTMADKPVAPQTDKAGRAFIKISDTKSINAIVDLSATIKNAEITGTISALVSKTADREPFLLADGTTTAIRFGLYSGTVSGKQYIYLGIHIEELTISSQSIRAYIAGINFKAIDDTTIPTLGVTEIAIADISEDGELGVANLSVTGNIKSDHYKDHDGNSIWEVETDGDLAIGNLNRQLVFYSINRPTIEHSDLSKHEIAYLTDIAQSVYWQKAVNYIDDTLDILNNRRLYFNSSGDVVSPNSPDIDPTKTVPGVYTNNPYALTPDGQAFVEDDTALVRDGTDRDSTVADGKYNGVFTTGSANYQLSQITGLIDNSLIKIGSGSTADKDGTILIDLNGSFAKITALDLPNGVFTALGGMQPPFFAYYLPSYAHFTNGAWVKDDTVPIPLTFDGYVTDISYEWSGLAAVKTSEGPIEYFHDTYVTWTAHHQNGPDNPGGTSYTMNYSGNAWDYIGINLDGYRPSLAQNVIDDALTALAATQSDYADERQTISFKLPERIDEKQIPNPAFIQHKPWTGIAVIDGGTFVEPLYYGGWFIDGGDFTGLNGATLPIGNQQPQVTKQFKNAIIKMWHGNLADEPPASNHNFDWTLRWIDDTKEFHFSDGVQLWKFPASASGLVDYITSNPTALDALKVALGI